jgi:hypothetical protein
MFNGFHEEAVGVIGQISEVRALFEGQTDTEAP